MDTITWQLIAVLVAASLLGFLIGLSGMRLHQIRKEKQAYNDRQSAIKKYESDRDAASREASTARTALESERKLAGLAREKQAELLSQQEALQVHAGLQAERVAKLSSELHSAEEKNIRLQRDFASFKANKLREVRMLKVSSDEWLDNEELPVLNKKVHTAVEDPIDTDFANAVESGADLTQPIIASELDIPSLAESELPDSVEE